jgi:hypothetical protein
MRGRPGNPLNNSYLAVDFLAAAEAARQGVEKTAVSAAASSRAGFSGC